MNTLNIILSATWMLFLFRGMLQSSAILDQDHSIEHVNEVAYGDVIEPLTLHFIEFQKKSWIAFITFR
jgi:hypothetical protein